MSQSLDELRQAVLALPIKERLELVEVVRDSLVSPAGAEESAQLSPAWRAELERRAEELVSGKVQASRGKKSNGNGSRNALRGCG